MSWIDQTDISSSIRSYRAFLENPMQVDVYTKVIPSVLRYYDLGDLMGKVGKGRVGFVD